MCGIAGIFYYRDPQRTIDRELLTRMTRRLAHRGPDGEGLHIDRSIGLGHRRLAIVDLTPSGYQPMCDDSRQHWISYNGEFYNHAQFRKQLQADGVRFRGTSDTETLLNLLAIRGGDCLRDSAGIFAFAYWNAAARRLMLARDHLGVKQLYYHDNGTRIIFASEIKSLLECDEVARDIDPEAVNQYLPFHTPLFERTFFHNIKQVKAGHYLTIDSNGIKEQQYWQLDDFTARGGSAAENIAALKELLGEIVSSQLMADVPVGSFFSGGIDSSAVAAFAQRAGKAPRCFGIHYQQGVIDERPYQQAAARALGLELELITLDGHEFPDDLMKLSYYQDEPVIGAALISMYHVSRLAAQRVKVCLGGQAADEIFGGYARYALARPAQVLRSIFAREPAAKPSGDRTVRQQSATVGGNLWKQLFDARNIRRLLRNVANITDWRARYFENFAKVPERNWQELFNSELVSRARAREIFNQTVMRSPAVDAADKIMHWDLQTYLTGLFHQDDRMSMANSLESRVPFADPRLVTFAFHSGFDLKMRAGASKWLLRNAVADVIPAEVLNRRKVGFDTPVELWLKTIHRDFAHDLLLSTAARNRGWWRRDAVERMLARTDDPFWFDIVWKLISIEAWARIFLDREIPAGINFHNDDLPALVEPYGTA